MSSRQVLGSTQPPIQVVSHNYCSTGDSTTEYSFRRPRFHKTVRRELHKSSIHGRAATAKPLITRKRWCHDHKTWTSDNWKRSRGMVRWVVLHAVSYIRTSLRFENIQGRLQSGIPGFNSDNTEQSHYSNGIRTWTGWVIMCFEGSAVFQEDNAPFHTAGTVQSWFKGHEGEIQHLPWPAQSPDLRIIQLL
jgi:hypothetical protein